MSQSAVQSSSLSSYSGADFSSAPAPADNRAGAVDSHSARFSASYPEGVSVMTNASSSPQVEVRSAKKSDTAFRTISEVADELDVPQHVLRFWETKFSQIKPLKRGGGRRYYRPEDVSLVKHIHHLLYTEGYTIKGVQKLLKGQGRNQIAAQAVEEKHSRDSWGEDDTIQARVSNPSAPIDPRLHGGKPSPSPAAAMEISSSSTFLSGAQRMALEATLQELKALRAQLSAVEDVV